LLSGAASFASDDVTIKHTLTLDGAKKAADAAVAYAKANGAPSSGGCGCRRHLPVQIRLASVCSGMVAMNQSRCQPNVRVEW
jgi:hypothetical protein